MLFLQFSFWIWQTTYCLLISEVQRCWWAAFVTFRNARLAVKIPVSWLQLHIYCTDMRLVSVLSSRPSNLWVRKQNVPKCQDVFFKVSVHQKYSHRYGTKIKALTNDLSVVIVLEDIGLVPSVCQLHSPEEEVIYELVKSNKPKANSGSRIHTRAVALLWNFLKKVWQYWLRLSACYESRD